MVTYDINLCIGASKQGKSTIVKCHDTGVNFLVKLYFFKRQQWHDVHEPYEIPEGATAVLKLAKPDKTFVVVDGEIKSDGILFAMHPQSFTVAGKCSAEVSLFNKDGRRITTASFLIEVVDECVCHCEEESKHYVDVVGQQVKAANEAADRAEEAAKRAEEASGGGGSGEAGKDGKDGGYYIPEVSQVDDETMRVSFASSSEDMPSIADVEITLPRGANGKDGADGKDGDKGEKGDKGDTGTQGEQGPQGEKGADGINGKDGQDGYSPVRGVDYWTESDKAEIQQYIDTQFGEIDTALDELHTYAQNLVGGDA